MRSEDLAKLRALVKLFSVIFYDKSLLVVAWRRIFEVLELARGKKKQKKKNPRKLEILDACFELGRASSFVEDFDDCRRNYKRAKEGYEEQLRRDSEKALELTKDLTMVTGMSHDEKIEKLRDLLKRM